MSATAETYASEHTLSEEEIQIDRWRFERMTALGLGGFDALDLVCHDVSWHEVEELVGKGCPTALVADVLLGRSRGSD